MTTFYTDTRVRKREDNLYYAGLLLLEVSVILIPVMRLYILPILEKLPWGCVLYRLFGVYCPGCGGTRAVNALLHGHIIMSLWYHPLIIYCVALYLGYMVSWTFARFRLFGLRRGMRFRAGYLYGMLAVVAVNFVLKNVLKFCFDITML